MSFNFFPAIQENALPLHIYREEGEYCRLSHLRYGTTNAEIKKMRRFDVPTRLAERNQQLLTSLDGLLQKLGAPSWLQSVDYPNWSFLLISGSANHSSWLFKSYFIQELCKRGILNLGSHNINLAHGEEDMVRLLSVYAEILPALTQLDDAPIQPVFKVHYVQPNAGNSANGVRTERANQLLKGPNETCR